MRCRWCRRLMTDGEPAHRVSTPYVFEWPDRLSYPKTGFICTDCATTAKHRTHPTIGVFDWRKWLAPIPCSHCGRPVIHDNQSRVPEHVVCSEECRQAGAQA